jgi:ABC-type phosphate transport system substrate-binding protein
MREFFRFILSREGQAIVSRDGYFPLPPGYAGSLRAGLER